jgi:hypothetical protein
MHFQIKGRGWGRIPWEIDSHRDMRWGHQRVRSRKGRNFRGELCDGEEEETPVKGYGRKSISYVDASLIGVLHSIMTEVDPCVQQGCQS